jgi:hypothetical protein
MRKYLYALALLLAVVPTAASANYFPTNATTTFVQSGSNATKTVLIATSTNTILNITGTTDKARDNQIVVFCGNTSIFDNNAINNVVWNMQYLCTSSINYTLSGNGGKGVNFSVTYVVGTISTTTTSSSTGTSTTENSTTYNGVNFNEWLLGLCVIIFMLSLLVWRIVFSPITTAYGR